MWGVYLNYNLIDSFYEYWEALALAETIKDSVIYFFVHDFPPPQVLE